MIQKYIIILALLVLAGCAGTGTGRAGPVHHVVVCWLKEPGNPDHCRQIIEASKSFKHIPGVLDIRAGKIMPTDRRIADNTFDLAVIISFKDRKSLAGYFADPRHTESSRKILQPLVRKTVVYDVIE